MHKKRTCCYLMYYGTCLSWSYDPMILMQEKCEMIVKKSVRYPEGLKIYFGAFEWLFDCNMSYKEASRFLSDLVIDKFCAARLLAKLKQRGYNENFD